MKFDNLWNLDKHIHILRDLVWASQIFLVGWVIRDALFGKITHDVDATWAFLPDVLWKNLQENAEKMQENKRAVWLFRTEKFGTATILVDDADADADTDTDTWESVQVSTETSTETHTQISYEVTPFREEWNYEDVRHPSEIKWTNSLLIDAGRRDFTINAMYYTCVGNPKELSHKIKIKQSWEQIVAILERNWRVYIQSCMLLIVQDAWVINELFANWVYNQDVLVQLQDAIKAPFDAENVRLLIDPMHWLQDAYAQKIRTVWDPDKRFNEDALRILRALRFANIRNQELPWARFDFVRETRDSLKNNYNLIPHLAKERIHQELVKVFSANNPFWYVALLDEANILQFLFPALYKTKHNDQPVRYHPFDTYAHTLLTLWHLQKINKNYLVKLWMLYHDVGKPEQYEAYAQANTKEERNAIHHSDINHVISGPVYTKEEMGRLWFSNKEIEEIMRYVGEHMRPGQILEAKWQNRLKKVRALYADAWYERTKNLFDVCKADRLWQYNPLQWSEVDAVDELYILLDQLRDTEGQFTKDQLALTWNDIMEQFDLKPWPRIGEMLDDAFQRVLHEKSTRNTKENILQHLKESL